MSYAVGRKAIGICDRCGFEYLLKRLYPQIKDMKRTGMLVCSTCLDEDQPQLQLGRLRIGGPQALRNPRPDTSVAASRFLESYEFVGGLQGWSASDTGSTLTKSTDSDLALFDSGNTGINPNNNVSIYKGSNRAYPLPIAPTGDPSINLDSSKYSTVSMRVARTSAAIGGSLSWFGSCIAINSSDETVTAAVLVPSDPSDYNVLTWDMSSPTSGTWSGMFESINFVFWVYTSLPSTGYQLSIDYIKFS